VLVTQGFGSGSLILQGYGPALTEIAGGAIALTEAADIVAITANAVGTTGTIALTEAPDTIAVVGAAAGTTGAIALISGSDTLAIRVERVSSGSIVTQGYGGGSLLLQGYGAQAAETPVEEPPTEPLRGGRPVGFLRRPMYVRAVSVYGRERRDACAIRCAVDWSNDENEFLSLTTTG
jgi:hypothetical protein